MNPNIKHMLDHYKGSKIKEETKVREVLQQAALLGLSRHGFFEKAAFYGGTALRILYGLDRFSEDLDFTLLKSDFNFNFQPYLEGLQRELQGLGFEMEVTQKVKNIETSVVSAFMKINTIQLYIAVGEEKKKSLLHPNEKTQIKIEVDVDPPSSFNLENRLVLNPVPFYVSTLTLSDLFAGKMHAILFRTWKGRVKGRDWYDLIWYIRNNVRLNIKLLESYMHQSGALGAKEFLSRERLIELLLSKIETIDWKNAALDIQPFIVDTKQLDIWGAKFFSSVIAKLVTE